MLPGRFLYDSMFGLDRVEDMSCDIYEKDSKYHLEMDIPGFTKDDIKIECHKGTITVSANIFVVSVNMVNIKDLSI